VWDGPEPCDWWQGTIEEWNAKQGDSPGAPPVKEYEDVLAEMIRKWAKQYAERVDEAVVEAMRRHKCGPEGLAIQESTDASGVTVRLLGPSVGGMPREVFKELRFEWKTRGE